MLALIVMTRKNSFTSAPWCESHLAVGSLSSPCHLSVPFLRWKLGGLLCYGNESCFEQFPARSGLCRSHPQGREAEPSLPVQAPVKFELVINLKTAKALGLVPSLRLLEQADMVIE